LLKLTTTVAVIVFGEGISIEGSLWKTIYHRHHRCHHYVDSR